VCFSGLKRGNTLGFVDMSYTNDTGRKLINKNAWKKENKYKNDTHAPFLRIDLRTHSVAAETRRRISPSQTNVSSPARFPDGGIETQSASVVQRLKIQSGADSHAQS
jgi:hypothetical protein